MILSPSPGKKLLVPPRSGRTITFKSKEPRCGVTLAMSLLSGAASSSDDPPSRRSECISSTDDSCVRRRARASADSSGNIPLAHSILAISYWVGEYFITIKCSGASLFIMCPPLRFPSEILEENVKPFLVCPTLRKGFSSSTTACW